MPNTRRATPDDILEVVREVCTVYSYNKVTAPGAPADEFECTAPEAIVRAPREPARKIQRGVGGSRPTWGTRCLAGNSWLNDEVINATLERFGAARCKTATYSIDKVGLERVCAVRGAGADDAWLRQCDKKVRRRELPPEARTCLERLEGRHEPADIDVFLLPVNVDAVHWFLLSATVRAELCVVHIHEPYGTEKAESRTAAARGFSALIWRFLHPDVDVPPALDHDIRTCAGYIPQTDGFSCGVYTLWSAFVCAMQHGLGSSWPAACEQLDLRPDLPLLRRFFAQMIYQPLRLSDLVARCQQRSLGRPPGAQPGAAPDSGSGSGGGAPGSGPDGGAWQRGAPSVGVPPARRLRSTSGGASLDRIGRTRGLGPTAPTTPEPSPRRVLRQSVLPGAPDTDRQHAPTCARPTRKKSSVAAPATLHRFFPARFSVPAGSSAAEQAGLASDGAGGGVVRAMVGNGADGGVDGSVRRTADDGPDGGVEGRADGSAGSGASDGDGVDVNGGVGHSVDAGAGDGLNESSSSGVGHGMDEPTSDSDPGHYYDIYVSDALPVTRYCGVPPRVQAVFEAQDDGSFCLCSLECYDSAGAPLVSPTCDAELAWLHWYVAGLADRSIGSPVHGNTSGPDGSAASPTVPPPAGPSTPPSSPQPSRQRIS